MKSFLLCLLVIVLPHSVFAHQTTKSTSPLPSQEQFKKINTTPTQTISSERKIAGLAAGYVIGFGTGHLVQGRYLEKGWLFTIGDAIGTYATLQGLRGCAFSQCENSFWVGLALLTVFKTWQLVDLAKVPTHSPRKPHHVQKKNVFEPNAKINLFVHPAFKPNQGHFAGVSIVY